jgi:hypothetical protein
MTNYITKKRVLYIFLVLFFFFIVAGGTFYFFFVRVKPEIIEAYKNRNMQKLAFYIYAEQENWYQKAEALSYYAELECSLENVVIADFIVGTDISMRRAVFEGCYNGSVDNAVAVLPYGLRDSYSWNRYRSLEYIQQQGLVSEYREEIIKLSEDYSSMVKNKALEMVFKNK